MALSSNSSLVTAPVTALIVTVVLIGVIVRKRRLVPVKNGIPLPPGPSAGWFWGSTAPTEK